MAAKDDGTRKAVGTPDSSTTVRAKVPDGLRRGMCAGALQVVVRIDTVVVLRPLGHHRAHHGLQPPSHWLTVGSDVERSTRASAQVPCSRTQRLGKDSNRFGNRRGRRTVITPRGTLPCRAKMSRGSRCRSLPSECQNTAPVTGPAVGRITRPRSRFAPPRTSSSSKPDADPVSRLTGKAGAGVNETRADVGDVRPELSWLCRGRWQSEPATDIKETPG